jgi:hypothetical protein
VVDSWDPLFSHGCRHRQLGHMRPVDLPQSLADATTEPSKARPVNTSQHNGLRFRRTVRMRPVGINPFLPLGLAVSPYPAIASHAPLAGRREFRRRDLICIVAALGIVRLCEELRRVSREMSTTVAEESNHWVTRNSSPEWSSPPSSCLTVAVADPASIRGMEHPT